MDSDKLILRLLPVLTSQMMTLSVTTEGQETGHYVPPTLGLGFPHSQWLPGTLFPPSKLQPVLRPFPLGFGFTWLLPTHPPPPELIFSPGLADTSHQIPVTQLP